MHGRAHIDSRLQPRVPRPSPVELTIPTAALVRAIGQLAIHFPLISHAEAWRVLTAELA